MLVIAASGFRATDRRLRPLVEDCGYRPLFQRSEEPLLYELRERRPKMSSRMGWRVGMQEAMITTLDSMLLQISNSHSIPKIGL